MISKLFLRDAKLPSALLDTLADVAVNIVVGHEAIRLVMPDGPKGNGKNGQTAENIPSEAEAASGAEDDSLPF